MTLWEPYVKNEGSDLASVIDQKPIFAAIRVRLVPYNGITINTRNNSSFLINPTIPPALELRSWLIDNMIVVNELLNSKDLIANAREFGKEATNAITTVSAVSTHTHLRLFNVKCTLQLADYNQSFVFMSCSGCHGKTTAAYNETYRCNFCGKADVSGTPKARAEVNVRDYTATVLATLLGHDAETFLGCIVSTLYKNLMLAEPKPMQTIIEAESKEDVFVQLRVYTFNYQGVPTRKLGAFFIDAPADVPNPDPSSSISVGVTQTLAENNLQTIVEAEDPDITPEEKQILANILNRKRRKHELLLPSKSSPVRGTLNSGTTHHVATSPVTTALKNATARSAIHEHVADDPIPNNVPREDILDANQTLTETQASNDNDDDLWNELMKGPPPIKKISTKSIVSKPTTRASIVQHVASSPVSTTLSNATVRSAIIGCVDDDQITNIMSEEEALHASGTTTEETGNHAAGDDHWNDLLITPPLTKKNSAKSTVSKVKRRLDI